MGLAFDEDGVLYALEAPAFGVHVATMRTIHPDGSFGASFTVTGDDSANFFVGDMAYDTFAHRLLVTDNTADGRVYSIDELGNKQTLSTGLPGVAGIVARNTGEIFVTTSPFGSPGEVFQIDPATGAATSVLGSLGYGAGVAFDASGNLIVQDASTSTFQGRLQLLPMTDTQSGLVIGSAQPLLDGMQSSAGVLVAGSGPIFTTGVGGIYRVAGARSLKLRSIRTAARANLQRRLHSIRARSLSIDLPVRTVAGSPTWLILGSRRRIRSSRC